MNKRKLAKEGKKWVEKNLISEEQLESILKQYKREDKSYLLIILSALLISISVIVFIFSEWAQIPTISRMFIMLLMMLTFYMTGFYLLTRRNSENLRRLDREGRPYHRLQIIGFSLTILGYITFGASLLLTIYMYHVQLYSAWPFFVWSLVGFLLYLVIPNRYLFTVALLITIYGQLHSGLSYNSFNYSLFVLFIFGYFHFVFHREYSLHQYIFVVSLPLQFIVLSAYEFTYFYSFHFLLLLMYSLSVFLRRKSLGKRMMQISVVTLLIYKVYETIVVQDPHIMDTLAIKPFILVFHMGILLFMSFILLLVKRDELITMLLFIPVFFFPKAHLLIIVSLFIYSIYWVIMSFQKHRSNKLNLGLFSLSISIITVIIQYAWETINKSLFFLLMGLLLFILSMYLERKRRKNRGERS